MWAGYRLAERGLLSALKQCLNQQANRKKKIDSLLVVWMDNQSGNELLKRRCHLGKDCPALKKLYSQLNSYSIDISFEDFSLTGPIIVACHWNT